MLVFLASWCISSSSVCDHTPTSPLSCSFMYSLSYLQASCLTEYGLRVSLRMTLAHSSPPCSQMCRYSCPWTTPPCTSLSLLTWGCPCVAWRFSTNHWPLTSTTSRLLIPLSQQLFEPNHHYFLFPTVPRPSTSCGTSCVWQVGVQTLVSLSLLRPLHPSITTPPTFSLLACEKAVYPAIIFSLSTSASICMFFFMFVSLVLSSTFS